MKSPKAPDAVDVQVGQRIRVQRLAIRMTQAALGNELGVTFQQVQKYEKGVTRVGAARLAKIAEVLRVPVANLLEADKDTKLGDSALALLGRRGALKLLRAFSKLSDDKMRRSVVQLVERIAAGGGLKKAPTRDKVGFASQCPQRKSLPRRRVGSRGE
jgi:transcriptional regulator with XRE-family HTH domain